jgi:hypothetical protein
VVHEPNAGKGQALRTGVASTDAELLVFLDAELVGLRLEHVDDLVELVSEGRGRHGLRALRPGPRWPTPSSSKASPVLTGQRALHRSLFERLGADDIRGYRVEAALNSLVARNDLQRVDPVLPGLWHRTKEEKLSSPVVGLLTKLAMLGSACWSYLRFALMSASGTRAGRVVRRTAH